MTTDLAHSAIWMFGGHDGTNYLDETWVNIAGTWTQLSPMIRPSARYGAAMVADLGRSLVVLFGGNTALGPSAETWEWDGLAWQHVLTTVAPSARYEHAMAFDLVRNRTVLYGGSTGGTETWEYDGAAWTRRTPAVAPPSVRGHGMAFHLPSASVLLFGGNNNQTWLWDGNVWTRSLPVHSPSARIYFGTSEDLIHGRILVFGGRPGHFNDTWEWTGLDWIERHPAATPPGRAATSLALDPSTGEHLLFGGNIVSTPVRFDDTWMFQSVSATVDHAGIPCAGTAGSPALTGSAPWLGTQLDLRVTNVPSGTIALFVGGDNISDWNGVPLPLGLDLVGMTGCTLYVRPDLSNAAFTNAGAATWSALLPLVPAFAGVTLYFQSVVFDAGANLAGLTTSDAIALHLTAP